MTVAVESAVRGGRIVWGAPTYRQCGVGYNEVRHAAGDVAEFHVDPMSVRFPRKGSVEFVSLDNPDSARGKTADGVVIDEAGFVTERAWYEVLRPMISDTGGWAFLLGTPKGRNWFWREHVSAQDRADSRSWQVPTLGVRIDDGRLLRVPHPLENPDFPFDEAVRMYETMPEMTFRQEFLAEFVDDAGLVFRNVGAVSTAKPAQPIVGHRYVFGVDWARSYDWTVISVLDATDRTQVYIDRFNRIDYVFQSRRLASLAAQWQPELILAEANAMGQPLVDQLADEGLPIRGFVTTSQSKALIIQGLSLAIERNAVTLLDDDTQKAELNGYDAQTLPGGSIRYGAVEGMHDDTVMALALAWHASGLEVNLNYMPSIYEPVGPRPAPPLPSERRASEHSDSPAHIKWAQRHFCPACYAAYQDNNA